MTKSTFSARYKRLRALLIKARKDRGLTQAQVAAKIHKPQSFVSKYEQGERRIDVVEFLEISRALGIDSLEILRELEKSR